MQNSSVVATDWHYIETFSRYFDEGLRPIIIISNAKHNSNSSSIKNLAENQVPWVFWAGFGAVEVFLLVVLGFCVCLFALQRRLSHHPHYLQLNGYREAQSVDT